MFSPLGKSETTLNNLEPVELVLHMYLSTKKLVYGINAVIGDKKKRSLMNSNFAFKHIGD